MRTLVLCGLAGWSLWAGPALRAAPEIAFEAVAIDSEIEPDQGLLAYLTPYQKGLEAFAAEVVGIAAEPLTRTQPESGLSNLVADSLRIVGEQEFETSIDFAVTNFGGLRRDLPRGPLTMGLVMELSPFDNYMVYLEVRGELVLELARSIASGSASAISGLKVVADGEGGLVSAEIGGAAVLADQTYKMVTIDYLVASWKALFREEWILSQQVSNKLVQRDAIVLYLSRLNEQGVEISDTPEGRVVIGN